MFAQTLRRGSHSSGPYSPDRRNVRLSTEFAEPTTALFMPTVVSETTCPNHHADRGVYCFTHEALNSDRIIAGICNRRAKKAGFDGLIKPSSLISRPAKV